jgi:hypothetical protein
MQMNRKELEAFAKEAARGFKPPEVLNNFSRMLKKITVEAALNAEMEEHLGYEKRAKSVVKNSRNCRTSKRVKRKMVSLTSIHHDVMALLSLSWSKRISLDLRPWMKESFGYMRKA